MARQRRAGEVLAQTVMQFVANAALFPLARFQQFFLQPHPFADFIRQRFRPHPHPFLKLVLKSFQPRQQGHHDQIKREHDQRIPHRHKIGGIILARRDVCGNPSRHAQRRNQNPERNAHGPHGQKNRQQIKNEEKSFVARHIIHHADQHHDGKANRRDQPFWQPFKSPDPRFHARPDSTTRRQTNRENFKKNRALGRFFCAASNEP